MCRRVRDEGWTISRYRQTGGRMPEGDPELILEDLDFEVAEKIDTLVDE